MILRETAKITNNRQKAIEYTVDRNGCHVCVSHVLISSGYPPVTREHKTWRMSRYVYTITKGSIPKGLLVRHTCDNRRCINPEHLILGTYLDNAKDCLSRGRWHSQKGETNNMAILTEKQVSFILGSNKTVAYLAKKYGVAGGTIYAVRSRKNWKYIPVSKSKPSNKK